MKILTGVTANDSYLIGDLPSLPHYALIDLCDPDIFASLVTLKHVVNKAVRQDLKRISCRLNQLEYELNDDLVTFFEDSEKISVRPYVQVRNVQGQVWTREWQFDEFDYVVVPDDFVPFQDEIIWSPATLALMNERSCPYFHYKLFGSIDGFQFGYGNEGYAPMILTGVVDWKVLMSASTAA